MDMPSILDQITKDTFLASPEPTIVYRLGLFNNTTHDLVELYENIAYPPHFHLKAEGYIHFIVSEGILTVDGGESPYQPGTSIFIAKGVKHGFLPKSQTLFLSIQSPPVKDPETGKEDILY